MAAMGQLAPDSNGMTAWDTEGIEFTAAGRHAAPAHVLLQHVSPTGNR